MARCLKSSFPWVDARRVLLALLVATAVAGCAGTDGRGLYGRAVAQDTGSASSHLDALRDYLSEPPEGRLVARERLRERADKGGKGAQLEYAFALSTHLDDATALSEAYRRFESLLTQPDPLPVALDGLVRLQLASVTDRLQRFDELRELGEAEAACFHQQQSCHASLVEAHETLDQQREELETLQRKLAALTRIEQTVNDGPEVRNGARRSENTRQEENDATVPPDSARR